MRLELLPLRFSLFESRPGLRLLSVLARQLFLCCLFVLAGGCGDGEQEPEQLIRLDRLSPLPDAAPHQQEDTLRVAVAAILSPEGTIQSYQPFLHYLENKTGKNVVLTQRKTYQEVNDLLNRQVVDTAFVCTGAFLQGRSSMELLVVPQIDGKITYRSLLIAPAGSQTENLAALRGKVFAFTDPLSNSGYHYPLSLLKKMGENPEKFFGRTIFTYSHDRSITAVLEGIADAAAVDSIIYGYAKQHNPQVIEKTMVIWQSEEFGMPPVVVPKNTSPETAALLKAIFLTAHTDPDGAKALKKMGVERFVEPDANIYSSPTTP